MVDWYFKRPQLFTPHLWLFLSRDYDKGDTALVLFLKRPPVLPLVLFKPCHQHVNKPGLACWQMRDQVKRPDLAEAILDQPRASWPPTMKEGPAKISRAQLTHEWDQARPEETQLPNLWLILNAYYFRHWVWSGICYATTADTISVRICVFSFTKWTHPFNQHPDRERDHDQHSRSPPFATFQSPRPVPNPR